MAGGRGVCVGVWVLLSVAGLALGRCSSSTDCGSLECCNVGMMRYSIPQCVPLGDLGSWCRINAEPVDLSLHYPNNQNINVKGGYLLMCPCRPGLVCSRESSTCQLPTQDTVNELNVE
ncbi:astakine-like [Homarus americanus]|uniref:astakine-like n=1 Tax=Homarus americanus TaxID=6706 RepID=UPI001C455513|nr:astakine-like [Homarus americanus]